MSQLEDSLQQAKTNKAVMLTTVEAFYKEPFLLYDFLLRASQLNVDVMIAPMGDNLTDKKEVKI